MSRERDEDDRGSRRRDEDDRPRRRVEDDDRPRRRSSDDDGERRSRSRDDDPPPRRSRDEDDRGSRSRDRDDDRGSSRSGGRRFEYRERSEEQRSKRASMGASDFDKILKDHVKMWKPNDGDNRIRILPPTWDGAEHYGLDIYVHYGVGADRSTYLDLDKMKGEPDPVAEAAARARQDGDEDYAKELSAKRRVLVWIIDRDHQKDGVQAWAMPWGMDRDIVNVSKDKSTGEVFQVDHPDDGYDIEFVKKGAAKRTEYTSVAIARRQSPLGKDEWLDYAMDNPLPDMLQYFSYDHIKKAMGGGSYGKDAARDRDRDDDRGRGRDRDDDRGRERERDRDDEREERRPSRSRDRDEDADARSRSGYPEVPTWESVHEMTKTELGDLIEDEKLKIDPREAKDLEDLADWICDDMGLKKSESRRRVRDESEDDRGDKLADMRRRRERD